MIAPVGAMMEIDRTHRTLIDELNEALTIAEAKEKEDRKKREEEQVLKAKEKLDGTVSYHVKMVEENLKRVAKDGYAFLDYSIKNKVHSFGGPFFDEDFYTEVVGLVSDHYHKLGFYVISFIRDEKEAGSRGFGVYDDDKEPEPNYYRTFHITLRWK